MIGNSLHYQDYEWYKALEDGELKEEALRNKAIMEGTIDDDDEERFENDQNMPFQEDDEEYVAIKEDEYDDLTSTRKDACRAYQEIVRMMDEGWMCLELVLVTTKPVPVSQAENPLSVRFRINIGHTYQSWLIKEEMADKEAKSTTRKIVTNDQANYYSGITSITVNGKNAYELKGKFLDDLHKNAFSGTNKEDEVEHIEYFLKIVDLIDLPNVNQDKLRVVVFPISLVGDAWRWFDGIKGSIPSWVALTGNFFRK
ncbi:hypothetical protein Tco_1303077 [Tanacetum coccineum]